MPDKRDMHKAKSHRNSRNKQQPAGRRGNPSASQQLDARDTAHPAGPVRPGEPGASSSAASPAVTAGAVEPTGAPVPLGKRNKNRR